MHGRTRDGQLPPAPEDPYAQEIIDFARQLGRENADLREDNRKLALHTAAQATELAELRAKLEEARKDAERYQFFKSRSRRATMMGERPFWTTDFTLDASMEFDAAIDAAIAKEGP